MTIKDIARESGYAVGTVSRVLNNNPRVSEDARRKILAVVAQHGYQPNANAKHLKQQVPEGLALIVKGTQNALFADLLDKLQPCLEARGYTPTVYYNNGSTDELACAQTIFAERRPCGLFFIGAHPQCFTPALASLGIPCLLLTNNAAGLGIENLSSVSVDDRAAAAVMIEQLYAKGHRVIGIIGDRPETSRPSQQRLDGCLDALQRLGVPFDFDRQYRLADFSMQGGYAAAEHLLAHCPGLTAIFAMSDLMAVGAIRAIQDHGLRVPQDIAVAGYDGIALGRYTVPRLTTIRQNTALLSQRAAQILLASIEHNAPAVHEIVPFEPGADVYVINTCTVTNIADRKSRQMLHKAKKMNPDAIVIAAGCYVQTDEGKLDKDEAVDLILGNNQKGNIVQVLEEYEQQHTKQKHVLKINQTKEYEELAIDHTAEHVRAYIKVQDGCNQFCTYCIIPYARGRVRSRKIAHVMDEVHALAVKGYKEVVLTGIHLSSYGVDFPAEEKETLLSLIRAVHEVEGIERIRLGSLEPGNHHRRICAEHCRIAENVSAFPSVPAERM